MRHAHAKAAAVHTVYTLPVRSGRALHSTRRAQLCTALHKVLSTGERSSGVANSRAHLVLIVWHVLDVGQAEGWLLYVDASGLCTAIHAHNTQHNTHDTLPVANRSACVLFCTVHAQPKTVLGLQKLTSTC